MKTTFLKTQAKVMELPWLKLADRDRGQIDNYEGNPPVIFPCALISVSFPKRKNLTTAKQMRSVSITVRFAFERLYDSSSLNSEANRLKAMDYYDKVEQADELLQGFKDSYFTGAWECLSTIQEERPDMDVVRFTFTTNIMK